MVQRIKQLDQLFSLTIVSVPETGLCEGGERFQIEGSFPEHELTSLRLASGQV